MRYLLAILLVLSLASLASAHGGSNQFRGRGQFGGNNGHHHHGNNGSRLGFFFGQQQRRPHNHNQSDFSQGFQAGVEAARRGQFNRH